MKGSLWAITIAAFVVGVAVAFHSNVLLGWAAGISLYFVLTILDSIDDNLATLAQKQRESEKNPAKIYTDKGERTDLTA